MMVMSGRPCETELALVSAAPETVFVVVAEGDEAGAATMTVSGDPPDPAIVTVYGVAPGGNTEDLVTKR